MVNQSGLFILLLVTVVAMRAVDRVQRLGLNANVVACSCKWCKSNVNMMMFQ